MIDAKGLLGALVRDVLGGEQGRTRPRRLSEASVGPPPCPGDGGTGRCHGGLRAFCTEPWDTNRSVRIGPDATRWSVAAPAPEW